MAHHEPIVLIGIPPERIAKFIQGYVGRDVLNLSHTAPSERPPVDIVSGATVAVTVIAESMVRSKLHVARAVDSAAPRRRKRRPDVDSASPTKRRRTGRRWWPTDRCAI